MTGKMTHQLTQCNKNDSNSVSPYRSHNRAQRCGSLPSFGPRIPGEPAGECTKWDSKSKVSCSVELEAGYGDGESSHPTLDVLRLRRHRRALRPQ